MFHENLVYSTFEMYRQNDKLTQKQIMKLADQGKVTHCVLVYLSLDTLFSIVCYDGSQSVLHFASMFSHAFTCFSCITFFSCLHRGVFGGAISSMVFAFSASGDLVTQDLAKEILRTSVCNWHRILLGICCGGIAENASPNHPCSPYFSLFLLVLIFFLDR